MPVAGSNQRADSGGRPYRTARATDEIPTEFEAWFRILGLNARTGCRRVDCNQGPDREQDWTQQPPDLLEAQSCGSLTVRSGLIRPAPNPACIGTWTPNASAAYEGEAQISGAT